MRSMIARRLNTLTAAAVLAGCAAGAPAGNSAPSALRLLSAEPASTLLYVALGDSTVEGVGASCPDHNYVGRLYERLRAVYPRARLVNLGMSGATAAGVRNGQLPRALGLRPDLVTLSVGPNDVTQERDLVEYARDLQAILGTLTRQTTAVVVVNLIPDLTVTPRFRGKEIEPFVRQRVIAFKRDPEPSGPRSRGATRRPLRPEPTRSAGTAAAHRSGRLSSVGRRLLAPGRVVWLAIESRIRR